MIELIITLKDDGQLQISGDIENLQNRILCYGILELAKDMIRAGPVPSIIVPIHQPLPKNGQG